MVCYSEHLTGTETVCLPFLLQVILLYPMEGTDSSSSSTQLEAHNPSIKLHLTLVAAVLNGTQIGISNTLILISS
jgi:hypothetical protein